MPQPALFALCIDPVDGDRFSLALAARPEDAEEANDDAPLKAIPRVYAVAAPGDGGVLEIVDNGYGSLEELYEAWPALRPGASHRR